MNACLQSNSTPFSAKWALQPGCITQRSVYHPVSISRPCRDFLMVSVMSSCNGRWLLTHSPARPGAWTRALGTLVLPGLSPLVLQWGSTKPVYSFVKLLCGVTKNLMNTWASVPSCLLQENTPCFSQPFSNCIFIVYYTYLLLASSHHKEQSLATSLKSI